MRLRQVTGFLTGLLAAGCHSSTSPTTTTTTPTTTTTTYTLAVSGSAILTGLRERSQLTAIITNDDGTTQDVTKSTTWSSSDAAVATLSAGGVVTTVAPGHVHVTAVYQATNEGIDLDIVPVTTGLAGILKESDGRVGTFSLVVNGAIDPTPNSVSAQVTGTVRIGSETVAITGFFESLTGAMTISGADRPYHFDGVVTDGVLNATFTGPNDVTGVIASTSTTVS